MLAQVKTVDLIKEAIKLAFFRQVEFQLKSGSIKNSRFQLQ